MTNTEFLLAIFGKDYRQAHVTDFEYPPESIPKDQHMISWAGDYFGRYRFSDVSNQYFTISLFNADECGKARRRKALFKCTPCIVLDDVKEKLPLEEVNRLPSPSWILETSAGSEQWGYILNKPCTDRAVVENLLDGLVAKGLAPDGKDPGMRGVTRYVRLPDGYNNKHKRLINGQPFKCRILLWEPFNTVTIDELAEPFTVDVNAARREQRVDGASDVADHPLLHAELNIKAERSPGRFDVTCPWVDEHTDADDSGTAVFTNADGTIGFKCHHGTCQDRTGADLIKVLGPDFSKQLTAWQVERVFVEAEVPDIPREQQTLETIMRQLRNELPFSLDARAGAAKVLKLVDNMQAIERTHWHAEVRDLMKWSKPEFKMILESLRKDWYTKKSDESVFNDVVFVKELNQFYDRAKRIFYSPDAYQNAYSDVDAEVRKKALNEGRVTKVHRLDYAPGEPSIFNEYGTTYANTWDNSTEIQGVPGDVSRWLEHFDALDWGAYRKHILQWMAFTLRHPEQKINHMLIFGSKEGCGKDFLLYPLIKALGDNSKTIEGYEFLEKYNDYLMGVKHLHINEAEMGERQQATEVANRIKPLAAAPPHSLRIRQMYVKPMKIRNLVSCTMTTNSLIPIRLNGMSRRIFALWSELNVRDADNNVLPEWLEYWDDRWSWMYGDGLLHCIHYLRNTVDLSDFKPGQAPRVTEFLRSICNASKNPLHQTIEAFISNGVGAFGKDIITTAQAVALLRSGSVTAPELMYTEERWINPGSVTNVLAAMPTIQRLDGGRWRLR